MTDLEYKEGLNKKLKILVYLPTVSTTKDTPIVCHCNKGTTENAVQNLFIKLRYTEVYNLSGGYKNYSMQKNL